MARTGAGRAHAAVALAAVFVVLLASGAPAHAADFNQGVTSLSATQARVWFTPLGFTAGYVIFHYTMTGVAQQNLQMTYNTGAAQWEYTLSGLSTGSVVTYWFSYMKDVQYDSANFQYTHSGAAATATATTRATATATARPRATATATTARATATTARATATTARATATTVRATATATTARSTATATATARPTATATATATTATATATATTSGGSGCWPAWDSAATYVLGAQASRNGRNYTAAYWNVGLDPAAAGNAAPPNGGTPWFVDRFCGPTPTPLSGAIISVVSAAQFDNIFPYRNAFYTYNDFVSAVNAIPAFAGSSDANTKKREAAAALANFAHETGGLWYVKEIQPNLYCSTNTFDFPKHANGTPVTECACVAGQQYYGRGATQISWNYNYCAASEWIYGNNNFDDGVDLTLVNNPSLVEQNGTLAWKTAIWYWMTQTGPVIGGWPLQTSHDAITLTDPTGNYGFGGTIRAINGALECNGGNGAQVQSRITKFTNFLTILGYGGGQFGRNDC